MYWNKWHAIRNYLHSSKTHTISFSSRGNRFNRTEIELLLFWRRKNVILNINVNRLTWVFLHQSCGAELGLKVRLDIWSWVLCSWQANIPEAHFAFYYCFSHFLLPIKNNVNTSTMLRLLSLPSCSLAFRHSVLEETGRGWI